MQAAAMLKPYFERAKLGMPTLEGKVIEVRGMLVVASCRGAAVGDLYRIQADTGEILAEVVALRAEDAMLVPYGNLSGIRVGDRLLPGGGASYIEAHQTLCWVVSLILLATRWMTVRRCLEENSVLFMPTRYRRLDGDLWMSG